MASAADLINAAGFNVSELHMTAQLIGGQNVDLLFEGLAASVTKVITDDYGYVTGTSQTVVDTLYAALEDILASQEVRDALLAQGIETARMTPAEFARFLREDREQSARIVREAGIQVN